MFQIFNSLGVFVSPFVFSHRILEQAQRWYHTTSADVAVDVNLGFIEIIIIKKKKITWENVCWPILLFLTLKSKFVKVWEVFLFLFLRKNEGTESWSIEKESAKSASTSFPSELLKNVHVRYHSLPLIWCILLLVLVSASLLINPQRAHCIFSGFSEHPDFSKGVIQTQSNHAIFHFLFSS